MSRVSSIAEELEAKANKLRGGESPGAPSTSRLSPARSETQIFGEQLPISMWWGKGTFGGHNISVAKMTFRGLDINMGRRGFSIFNQA